MTAVRRPVAVVALLTLLLAGGVGVAGARPAIAPPAPATLAETVAALTTPAMEGRRSGTAGGEQAAAAIADWLRAAGLRPGGDAGSFFQTFPLSTGTRLAADNAITIAGTASAIAGTDWTPHGGSASAPAPAFASPAAVLPVPLI